MQVRIAVIHFLYVFFFFFKQKTAYEIGTGDWSSDVCSSDLAGFFNVDYQQVGATLGMASDAWQQAMVVKVKEPQIGRASCRERV